MSPGTSEYEHGEVMGSPGEMLMPGRRTKGFSHRNTFSHGPCIQAACQGRRSG